MRQRRGSLLGPLCASAAADRRSVEAALASKSASVREPRHGYARFGSHEARFNSKRFAAGLVAGVEIEPHCPRRSRVVASTSGDRRVGAHRQRAHA